MSHAIRSAFGLALLGMYCGFPLREVPAQQAAAVSSPRGDQTADQRPLTDGPARGESVAGDKAPAQSDAVPAKVGKASVASITVKGSLPESSGQVGLFGELSTSLADFVARLDRVVSDKSVSALVLKIRQPEIGPGKVRELRAAIQRVRAAGKHVTAQLESAASADYLVACACDEIVIPESGEIMIPGVRAELLYYKGLFDLVGIHPDMLQVGDFKGAAEPYTRREMSPEFRQQYAAVLDDIFEQMVELIAADRRLPPEKVRALIDVGLFLPEEAKAAGLVDAVLYDDELPARLRSRLDAGKIELVEDYGKKKVGTDLSGMAGVFELLNLMMGTRPAARPGAGKKLAIVFASGAITSGESMAGMLGNQVVGSDTLVKAIRQANDDPTVVAIVLRVDSPGGSALASDQIWRAIRQCDKPIVASMGDVAASGGYYIAMGCDKVFAEPGTITGSIGVVGGKLVLKGLFDKVGVSTDTISRGQNSGILSETSAFSDAERTLWQKMMHEIYRQFLAKVAVSRKMETTALEPLAGGRIWTGRQAQRVGLVDQVGTLRDAIAEAKKLAGQDPNTRLEVLMLPKPKSFLDQLMDGDIGATSAASGKWPVVSPRSADHLGELDTLSRLFREPALLWMPHRIRWD